MFRIFVNYLFITESWFTIETISVLNLRSQESCKWVKSCLMSNVREHWEFTQYWNMKSKRKNIKEISSCIWLFKWEKSFFCKMFKTVQKKSNWTYRVNILRCFYVVCPAGVGGWGLGSPGGWFGWMVGGGRGQGPHDVGAAVGPRHVSLLLLALPPSAKMQIFVVKCHNFFFKCHIHKQTSKHRQTQVLYSPT